MTYTTEALLAVLVTIICYSGTYLWGRMMMDRPIIVASLLGIVLGDIQTGLICGATLEAVFLGVSHIGGSNLNYCMATIFTTTFAIITDSDLETILALAVPISTLGTLVEQGYRFVSAMFVGYMDKLIEANEQKKYSIMRFVIFCVTHPIYWAVVFFGIAAGAEAVQAFLDSLPPFISATMNVSKGLFGGIGLALVLNQIWDKKYCAWFFFGFVLSVYAGLPTIAILVIAIAIAIALATIELEMRKNKPAVAAEMSEEEAFFNE
ncbi:MAG: PTS sugar transporter subunit IIC [Erysipelotrichaceae bacterium]|nr:PTS sugar transporter subunit IIC [Erysipelotrichaceae bacterium]MBQ7888353.1 PTS sugar transporter subunit IIC [Erysipelotrichaceae bacterium]